jgi:hypothetical protein
MIPYVIINGMVLLFFNSLELSDGLGLLVTL